ncbi:MAG: TonB-dependent receptor [Chitinophagaceae bacterium]|nr:TonB-dependent receptor [Chitinophagaceae bacterium]
MKLTVAMLLLSCIHVAAAGYSQDNVTLNLKSVEIRKVFLTIEKKTNYHFLFNESLLTTIPKVNIAVTDKPVTEVLNEILKNTGISFKIFDNRLIVLRPSAEGDLSELQDIRVNGKVTGANGEILSGVSITVKGSNTGTTTDANGNFSITVPDDAVLVFSYVGYEDKEMTVAGKSTINVSLQLSTKVIDQVVIVGYGTSRKIDLTGSVGTVKGDEVAKQSTFSPISALQGKVAGVQINNNGAPGSPPEIRIRGVGTVYGNANPLYVVDGIWYDDISFLNSNDIENISVLKDASSESIYGIRAANGVILITTKKGKRGDGKPVISYNGYAGNQVVTNQIKMATGSEYETMINELNVINGKPAQYSDPASAGNTDWYHQILRNAFVTNQQVSVLGGSPKSTFNLSLGYYNQNGLVKTNTFDRYNLHLQNDYELAKFLKVGVTINGALSNSNDINGSIFHQLYSAAPNVPVYYADGTYGDPNDFKVGSSNQFNPEVTVDFFDNHTRTYKLNGNAYADLKIAKYFTFHTSAGGDFEQTEIKYYAPVYTATIAQRNSVSSLSVSRNENRNWIVENTLTFDRKINDHSVKVLLGQGAQEYKFYGITASVQNVPNGSGNQYLSLGTASSANVSDNGSLSRVNSYFGRLNYSYKDKYLLTASMRADGSSKFSEANRWGYFPSVGLGWVITNEKFMATQKLFDNLKLRGSWGKIGNMSVPANLSVLTVTQTPGFIYVGGDGSTATGASINTVVPPATYWERGAGTDIGLEASMLNNKLYAELDWYNKKTEKAIFDIPILGSVGTSSGTIIGNQATFQNQGFEFLVTWKDKINKDWNYSISGNAGINNNKVLEVSTGANPIYQAVGTTGSNNFNTRTIIGEPIGEFFGYQVIGIFQSAQDIANYKSSGGTMVQPNAKPGDFKYQDVNGDGVIDAKDKVVLGNPNPKLIYGINTNVTYKDFDLTLDFQGVSGVQVYNANLGLRYGTENFTEDYYLNRWHGQGTSNFYPSANIGGSTNYLSNSFFVEDGSYFRIRNMQLGYTFPQHYFRNTGISRLRIYVNAQNAFNFFKYRGFSPEVGGPPTRAGVDVNVYPLYATYNFGVNLSF